MKSNQETKPRSKSNARKVLKDFCESTSLHGYGYIYNNDSIVLKLFWLFVIISMTGIGILLLVQNTIEFLEYGIYTTTDTSSAPLSVSNVWCTLFHSRSSSYEHFTTIMVIFSSTTLIYFTKLRFWPSFWGAQHVKILIGSKVMIEYKKFHFCFFTNLQNKNLKIYVP